LSFSWVLHALELYREMTLENPEPIESCRQDFRKIL
jgi:hypothetical protein